MAISHIHEKLWRPASIDICLMAISHIHEKLWRPASIDICLSGSQQTIPVCYCYWSLSVNTFFFFFFSMILWRVEALYIQRFTVKFEMPLIHVDNWTVVKVSFMISFIMISVILVLNGFNDLYIMISIIISVWLQGEWLFCLIILSRSKLLHYWAGSVMR